jgi:hypothetical protein
MCKSVDGDGLLLKGGGKEEGGPFVGRKRNGSERNGAKD